MGDRGPLAGVKVIELGGIGPGPHAGMVLADLGADVVRVRRSGVAIASAAKPGEVPRKRALSALGYADRPPTPPLHLVADYGGGSMLALLRIVAALYERERSGLGQVIDAAMVDGVSLFSQMMWTMKSTGALRDRRESFLLDGGAPFYRCYETSDGKYVAVGAIEPQFFAALLRGLELSPDDVPNQLDTASYPRMRDTFAERFAGRTRDEWMRIFAGTDACVTPVSTWAEAATDEHLRARSTLITAHGADQAAPAPRFSRTPAGPVGPPPAATTSITEINW
ncbi:CaiB/BaiF CoA-transferase family protein [Mycobacterium sp. 050134]|uniref:CaiB/BaiF CoA-transferase family protein n=1 Tax=Mycobacterium sp. 050134 TaxID=3096111 RepID=UPI002ED7D6A8